jgi:hypothetical protein
MNQKQYESKMCKLGFEICGTGGNCTAFFKRATLAGVCFEILITNDAQVPEVYESAVVTFNRVKAKYHADFSFVLRDHLAVITFAETLDI